MTNSLTFAKRWAVLTLAALMLAVLALQAHAASALKVGAAFWKEQSDKYSLANECIDSARQATFTRQTNGTYTLELPVQQCMVGQVSGYLTGIIIGDISYDGVLSGDLEKGTAQLKLENLPASVLTGSDPSRSLTVTCRLQTDVNLLGEISLPTRMGVWIQ
ncbi:MAG: pilin [Faecalibacterium sp.]